jgi:hypothetical protein
LPGAPPGAHPPEKDKTQPSKSKLEEMLAEALKNNPDIRVAAANVSLAEAELNRTRLQVTQKVIALHAALLSQKAAVTYQQKQYERYKSLVATKSIGPELLQEAEEKLARAKAKLTELESQMPALLGKTPRDAEAKDTYAAARQALEDCLRQGYLDNQALRRMTQELQKAQGPLAERIRRALETPITVNYKDVKFSEILKDLEKKAPGLSFHVRDLPTEGQFGADEAKGALHFDTPLPIAAILQAIEDDTGAHFIVRDYGILVTSKALPPGALTVQEFMRQKPEDYAKMRNPPPENIEGAVKQVDPSGSMTISIGSDAGLAKGQTLELFRLNPAAPTQSKYLGTVRILEVGPKEAVAQPVGRLAAPPKMGDKVASRILEK